MNKHLNRTVSLAVAFDVCGGFSIHGDVDLEYNGLHLLYEHNSFSSFIL